LFVDVFLVPKLFGFVGQLFPQHIVVVIRRLQSLERKREREKERKREREKERKREREKE
jgi:hypothetical protein